MTALMTTSPIADALHTANVLARPGESPSRPPDSVDDLRGIVGERGLVNLALQSVEHFGADLPLWHVTTDPGFSSRMLLALLTYSYAAGIYASEDIHWACKSDPGARYLCANTWPEERSLRRFRRQWRPLIQACLQWVCAVAKGSRTSRLTEFRNPVTGNQGQLAEQRIESALLMDMVACD